MILLEHKAFVNNQDDRGISPLHHAAEQGFEDVVARLLMCEDVKLNLQDIDGDTALHLAAHGINVIRGRQHKEVVQRLLAAGASINIERKNGRRPFELTKSKEIRALLEPGVAGATLAAGDTPAPAVLPSRKRGRASAVSHQEESHPVVHASPVPREIFPRTPQQQLFATPNNSNRSAGATPCMKDTQDILQDTRRKLPKPAPAADAERQSHGESHAGAAAEQQTDLSVDKKVELHRAMSNKDVDVMLYGCIIGETEMYRNRSNNSLISGRFLRMWLLQHTMPSKHARSIWEKASVLFYEPTRLMGSAV